MDERPSFGQAIKLIFSTPTLRQTIFGNTLGSFLGYACVYFVVSFLARVHGPNLLLEGQAPQQAVPNASLLVAFLSGIVGSLGTWMVGRLSDRYGKRDLRWKLWIVAVMFIAVMPFGYLAYNADQLWLSLLGIGIVTISAAGYLGPSYAVMQTLVPVNMRALSSAVLFLIINLIGLGLGPVYVGFMSDLFASRILETMPAGLDDASVLAFKAKAAAEGLRFALLSLMAFMVWAAIHYWSAGRSLPKDAERLRFT